MPARYKNQSVEENNIYYISQYGWVACGIAALGFATALLQAALVRQHVGFIIVFLTVSWMQWALSVRQLGFHYTLHFTLYIALGIFACLWITWMQLGGWKRVSVLGCMGLVLAINMLVGLSPLAIPSNLLVASDRYNLSLSGLFAANERPNVRSDYNEIVRLADYLRSSASPVDPIYVAASSSTVNDDLLWHAERALYENVFDFDSDTFWENKDVNILHWIPFADSRDYYPLEKLLLSQYVVVATPFQYHLHPDEQKVVNVVMDIFEQHWEFSRDFARLPQQFSLENNVTVTIYKRLRPTSLQTALRTLVDMQKYIPTPPGKQSNWVALSATPGYYISRNRDDTYDIAMDHEQLRTSATSFLYINTLPAQAVISGEIGNSSVQCKDPSLTFTIISANGSNMASASFRRNEARSSSFSVSLTTQNSAYMLLDVAQAADASQPDQSCWLNIHRLAISR